MLTMVLFGHLSGNAATYYSAYGQSRTTSITAVPATHTFEVNGIAINKWTEWYVNGVYTGSAQNDYSGIFANDPTYSYPFSSGTTQIRALVYNSDFSILHETHTWNVTVDTTAPTVPSLSSPANGSVTSDNTVSLDWSDSTDSGTDVSNYEVQADDSSGFGSPNYSATPTSSSQATSTLADGLYYWRVRAKDNAGNWSGYSSSRTFRVDTTAPSTPGTINASGVTATSATVSWGASSDAGGNPVSYEIQYKTDLSLIWGSTLTTTSTSMALTGLAPNTVYDVRIRARDAAVLYSNWRDQENVIVTPPLNSPPTMPGTISASGVTATSATVNWGASSDPDGNPITYEVQYKTDLSLVWGSTLTTTSTSMALTGLAPNTVYDVRVRARDTEPLYSNWRDQENVIVTPPLNSPPTTPGTITATMISSNNVSISWISSSDPDGDPITYQIEYDLNNTLFWRNSITSSSSSKTLTGLSSDNEYVVRVKAVDNRGGESSWFRNPRDPTFRTLPVQGIVAAYWLPPLNIAEGSPAIMRAEVHGYSVEDVFSFDVYEDDFPLNSKVTDTPLTGTVYASDGKMFVDVVWSAEWEDDISGDPEYFFKVFRGGVELSSSGTSEDELHVRQRRFWYVNQEIQSFSLNASSSSAAVSIPASGLPDSSKLAQVTFHWKATSATVPPGQDVYLDFFGPAGLHLARRATVSTDGAAHVITFQRGDFHANLSALPGQWGIRLSDATGSTSVQFANLSVSLAYYTGFQTHSLAAVPTGTRKLIVFVHGWNPDAKPIEEHYNRAWDDLQAELGEAMTQRTNWALAKYDWALDASTGDLGAKEVLTSLHELKQIMGNPFESMFGGMAHGYELGLEVEAKCPSLEKVHFIAHSAGNWAARGAAKYLKSRFPGLQIQVTSLDPFIPTHNGSPGEVKSGQNQYLDTESWPDAAAFAEMGEFVSFRDTYYTWDDETDYLVLLGTTVVGLPDAFYYTGKRLEQAGWDLGRLINSGAFTETADAPLFAATVNKYGFREANSHRGPVYWYSETTRACNDGNGSSLSGLGFASSILYREPSARIDSITPSAAQPPVDSITFQGSGIVNGGSIARWEWSSSMDGILGTSSSFTKSALELTVGAHAIAFRVRDSHGNWSDSVSANITVNNALPTAKLSGIPGAAVLAGSVLNLSLGGQDSDENGHAIVAGELRLDGTVVANSIGSYNLTAPAQPGNYTISYRVLDDEGYWSDRTSQTLTVLGAPCTLSLSSSSAHFGASGGNGSINVAASANDCTWQSGNPLIWVTITSGASGSGNGTLDYTVAANTSTNSRSGNLTIAGQSFAITQAGTLVPWLAMPTLEPSGRTNVLGSTATFSATSAGSDPLSYQWKFNGVDVADGGRITGATTPTLTINDVTWIDAGSYTVRVSNSAGETNSEPATLTVIGPLQARINQAPSGDTLIVDPGTYSEFLTIHKDLTLAGAGPDSTILDASGFVIGISIIGNPRVSISGISVRNANSPPPSLDLAAGILNSGDLTLSNCVVINNGNIQMGAGIRSGGNLTLIESVVTGNRGDAGGGISFGGSTLTIRNSTVSSNGAAHEAGGILLAGGVLKMENSTVDGNYADGGGGIHLYRGAVGSITGSLVSRNAGGVSGIGGIRNYGTLSLTNCTISGNRGEDGGGGGLWNRGTVTAVYCTISSNWCPELTSGDGGGINNAGTFVMQNCIVAGNTVATIKAGPDVFGTITSLGHNLIGDPRDALIIGDTTGNLLGVDPRLGPLQDNGGPTWTHALLADSPAVDGGIAETAIATDQRGVSRQQDGDADGSAQSDIGAFEFVPPIRPPVIVEQPSNRTNLIGTTATFPVAASGVELSFQWRFNAIDLQDGGQVSGATTATLAVSGLTWTNAGNYSVRVSNSAGEVVSEIASLAIIGPLQLRINQASPGDVVVVEPGTHTESLIIDKHLILSGAGPALSILSADGFQRAIAITNHAQVLLSGLTIRDANRLGMDAIGIENSGNLTISNCVVTENGFSAFNSGGIRSSGDLLVVGSSILRNRGDAGAGITFRGNSLVIENSTISSNFATHFGAALAVETGQVRMNRTTVSHNNGDGGVVFVAFGAEGSFNHSLISSNTGGTSGIGGIQNEGTLSLTNCTISGNEGEDGGGAGIKNRGTLVAVHCTIADNWCPDITGGKGGGVYNLGSFVIRNTLIARNRVAPGREGPDVFGVVTLLGNNLIGNTNDSSLILTSTNDLLHVDARLGPLQDNGGPTWTHALLPGSPAIDNAAPEPAVTTDQRGVTRPQDGNGVAFAQPDIGAFEKDAIVFQSVMSTDSLSLQVQGMAGRTYVLQRAPVLGSTVWVDVETNDLDGSRLVQFTVPVERNGSSQFYRIEERMKQGF